jgi:hypothetical protein
MINAQQSSIKDYPALSDDDVPPSTVRSFDRTAEEESPPSSALASLEELGKELKSRGPLAPARAVDLLRKAARGLAEAQSAGFYADTRSHVFWLGAVLYYALTGKAPLETPSGAPNRPVPPKPSSVSPHKVPTVIDELVLKCLAERRADRFASVIELRVALDTLPIVEVECPPSGNGEISALFRRERLAYRRRTARGPRGAARAISIARGGKGSSRPIHKPLSSRPPAHKIGTRTARPARPGAASLRAALGWLKAAACFLICFIVCSCSATHEPTSLAPVAPVGVSKSVETTSSARDANRTAETISDESESKDGGERALPAPALPARNLLQRAPLPPAKCCAKLWGPGAGNMGLSGEPGAGHCTGERRFFADTIFSGSVECEAGALNQAHGPA